MGATERNAVSIVGRLFVKCRFAARMAILLGYSGPVLGDFGDHQLGDSGAITRRFGGLILGYSGSSLFFLDLPTLERVVSARQRWMMYIFSPQCGFDPVSPRRRALAYFVRLTASIRETKQSSAKEDRDGRCNHTETFLFLHLASPLLPNSTFYGERQMHNYSEESNHGGRGVGSAASIAHGPVR